MEQLFNIDFKKVSSFSDKEAIERKKILSYFYRRVYQIKEMKTGNSVILIL